MRRARCRGADAWTQAPPANKPADGEAAGQAARRARPVRSSSGSSSRPPRRARPNAGKRRSACTRRSIKLTPDYVEGHWYQGHRLLLARRHLPCRDAFRQVMRLAPKNGAAYAFLGLCEFGLKDYDRVAAAPAPVPQAGRRRRAGSRGHRPLSRGHPDDADRAVRTGARDAGRVRQRGQRQPARHRGDGDRDAADADAADRAAGRPARDGADGRTRQLHDGDAQHRAARTPPSRRSPRDIRTRRTSTTRTAYSCCRSSPTRRSTEFKRELELQPSHPWSLMQIAYEYLKRGDAASRRCLRDSRPCRGAECVPGAEGARAGAARNGRRRRGHQGAPGSASSSRPTARACTSRSRAPISAPAGSTMPRRRAQRVHEARSPGANAAERRAVGRRPHRSVTHHANSHDQLPTARIAGRCRHDERPLLALVHWKLASRRVIAGRCRQPSLVALTVPSSLRRQTAPTPQRAPGPCEGVTRRARRRRRARQARPAGSRPDRDRLRDPRGRRSRRPLARSPCSPTAARQPRTAATAPANAPSSAPLAPAPASSDAPGVTALVFDRLEPGVAAPRRAGGARLPRRNEQTAPDYIGVFGIDLALAPYAPFTRNAVALRQALDEWRARARRSSTVPSSGGSGPMPRSGRRMAGRGGGVRGRRRAGGAGAAVGGRRGRRSAQLARMYREHADRDFELMERDQQGYATDQRPLLPSSTRWAACPGGRASSCSRKASPSRRPSSACSSASSTRPIAPTSASTPWTPRACAPRASRRRSAIW